MKNRMLIILLFVFCFTVKAERYMSVSPSHSYEQIWSGVLPEPLGGAWLVHWANTNNVKWKLHSAGASDGIDFNSTQTQINNAFNSWQNVSTSAISFSYDGQNSNKYGFDYVNTISWAETGDNAYTNGMLPSSGSLAVTIIVYNAAFELLDVDIVFNGKDHVWKINGEDKPDIQAIATHEIGHMIGLHHSELGKDSLPTMYYYYSDGGASDWRSLEFDDMVGASFLYGGNIIDNKNLINPLNYFYWDVNVNAGKTLTINNNVKFKDGVKIIVNGTLNVSGTLGNNIALERLSTSGSWGGLVFNSGSSGSVQYCNIKNASYGIYSSSSSAPSIINSEIMNCTYGIYCYNSSPPMQNNYIHNNQIGIALYGSSPILYGNQISYNSYHGVYCSSSSNPKFGNGITHGNNNIHHNSYKGIFCYNNSYPIIGKNSPVDGGYNILEQNVQHNVYSEVDGVTWAVNNWWGNNPPDANKIYCRNGAIAYNPWLTSPPSMQMNKNSGDIVQSDLSPLVSQIVIAENLIDEKKYEDARRICSDIIENYPDSAVAFNALNLLSHTYLENEKSNMTQTYTSIFGENKNNKLSGMAGLILAQLDFSNKIKIIDEVLSKHEGEEIVELALYDKFLHYYNTENDLENAKKILGQLEKQFPKSEAVLDAYRLLNMPEYIIKNSKSIKNDNLTESKIIDEFNLLGSYPNPFNPSTNISYNLPKMSSVEIRIYDLLGKEVRSFIFSSQTAGIQHVVWNGTNNMNEPLSSGIYIYRIIANSLEGKSEVFEKSAKLMLIK